MCVVDKAWCCHVGCTNDATHVITGPDGYEDYTHMCVEHVDEYTREGDVVESLEVKE